MEIIRPLPRTLVRRHVIPEPARIENPEAPLTDLSAFSLVSGAAFEKAEKRLRTLFHFLPSGGKPFTIAELENASSPEAYSIDVTEDSAVVKAASSRAALYAAETLRQIKTGDYIPAIKAEDAPCVPLRGFHVNLATVRQFEEEDVRALIRRLAKFKLNTFLVEYNERFPFAEHPLISAPNAFSPSRIASFEALCRENEIDVIPLVQCFGHNAHVSRHPEYGGYFEPGTGTDGEPSAQLCPLNPASFELFKELALEVAAAHPGGKYLHLGADETRSLGCCPRCAEFAAKHGKGRLYAEYINKAADWVFSLGRTPVIWDDMLSRHPEAVPLVRRDIVIMYWDYWTTTAQSPIFVARPFGKGIVSDKSWSESGFAGLNEPERLIASGFSRPTDMEELLRSAPPSAAAFRKYLGDGFPKYFTAFPFLDYYRDLGFKVICAPTTLGNTIDDICGLPNFMRFRMNIHEFAEKCKRAGGAGMITSSWYDFPPEMIELGLVCTANDLWKGTERK